MFFFNLLTADMRRSQPLSASALSDKLNAELQESFLMKEADCADGVSASKIYKVNNNAPASDDHVTGMVGSNPRHFDRKSSKRSSLDSIYPFGKVNSRHRHPVQVSSKFLLLCQ